MLFFFWRFHCFGIIEFSALMLSPLLFDFVVVGEGAFFFSVLLYMTVIIFELVIFFSEFVYYL